MLCKDVWSSKVELSGGNNIDLPIHVNYRCVAFFDVAFVLPIDVYTVLSLLLVRFS